MPANAVLHRQLHHARGHDRQWFQRKGPTWGGGAAEQAGWGAECLLRSSLDLGTPRFTTRGATKESRDFHPALYPIRGRSPQSTLYARAVLSLSGSLLGV